MHGDGHSTDGDVRGGSAGLPVNHTHPMRGTTLVIVGRPPKYLMW